MAKNQPPDPRGTPLPEEDRPRPEGDRPRRPRRVGVLVREGDSLRTLAERITGDANNWRQLRDAGITREDLVVGKQIKVPRRLLSEEFKEGRRERKFIQKHINSDIAYQEFRAQNALDRELVRNEMAAAEDDYNALIQRMAAGWEQERLNALTQNANEWEDRGLHNSGARAEDQVRVGAEEDRARNEWETQQRNELNARLGELQSDLLGLRTSLQHEKIAVRDRAGREWAQQEAERLAMGGAPRPENQTNMPRRPRNRRQGALA